MRPLIIPFSIWLVALQIPFPPTEIHTLAALGELLSAAGALAGFTVAVYRLGVWRQEMHHTKEIVTLEIARYGEELREHVARLETKVEQLEEKSQDRRP